MDTVVRDDKLGRTSGVCLLSWSAIIAGALAAFSLSALLNLLNAGLGLVAFPETFRGLEGVTTGGYIWLIICGIVTMFIAGWIAGKVARYHGTACHGLLHGFLAWSLALLLTVFLAGHFAHAAAEAIDKARTHNVTRLQEQSSDTVSTADASRAEQAADYAGGATIGLFIIFLLGAISAALGGYVGAKNDDYFGPTTTTTKKY